ncbi:TIGR03752 family integrating conjugative element protein [Aromatoleum toluvorans]|uniref:TIGR03752 family integrating conjugative element protein n=1 Tax=Aromatoleum toluvorans TaxID=92002 RepID=A0ABX1PSB7_9RHOO|nr:TIGR03752 family integrating conjugative element protein [Aromatoleum toluvorans]NMG42334.1 TIGR03752 family integrating conjugative element protein [Aromatoleum toluvorans]
MQIAQNKLVPVLTAVALSVTGFILYKQSQGPGVPAGPPMAAVPEAPLPPTQKGADADTPQETLNTVVAAYGKLNEQTQALVDENRRLRDENARKQRSEDRIREQLHRELRSELLTELEGMKARELSRSESPSSGLLNSPLLGNLPAGFGFEHAGSGSGANPANASSTAIAAVSPMRVLPLGYQMGKGADGKVGVVRELPLAGPTAARTQTAPEKPKKAVPVVTPFYTVPENATLTGVINMTAIVGRVPVDGKVTDPMQFKLLLGPENLAANGHYLPRHLSGVVVSGIAIGDMTLSCAEGLIQSLTFVFNDGNIQTVSRRNNGTTPLFGATGGTSGTMPSLAAAPKLGWISDRYGNPCIPGEFVTNAPAHLTDAVGLRTLSIAAAAAAAAQTTQTDNVFGTTTSRVSGDRGTYILGRSLSGGVDEVTSWIMRRLNNSFDAVVVPAGGEVVVHIDTEIPIDKSSDARKLDYGRIDDASTTHADMRGKYYGLD